MYTQRLLFCLFFLVQCSYWAAAQEEYRLFHPDVTYLYENPLETNAYTSPVLGMKLGAQACEVTYSSVQISPLSEIFDECIEVVSAFIGSEVCQQNNVTELTIDVEGESRILSLRHRANQGQSWLAMNGPEGAIFGKVEAVVEEAFLGLIDSVKYIALYRQHGDGSLIPLYEEVPFRISKQYGLLSAVFLHWLGQDFGYINLLGMSHPQVGLQNPSRESIFQLQQGDVLHLKKANSVMVQDVIQHNHREEQLTVTDVNWDENQAVLNYSFSIDGKYYSVGPDTSSDTTYLENYIHHQEIDWTSYAYLDGLPGQVYPQPNLPNSFNVLALFPEAFCDQPGKRLMSPLIEPLDGCAFPWSDVASAPTFYAQLAGPYYSFADFDGLQIRELKYAQLMSGYNCGDPFDMVVNTDEPITASFKIYPNPASDYVKLSWDVTDISYIHVAITDFSGRTIKQQRLQNKDNIDLTNLTAGIYILKCTTENGAYWAEKLVVN